MSPGEFNIVDGPAGKFISVDSDRLDETMTLFVEQEMAGIHISSIGPYKTKDLEFLRDHPDVTSVLVSEGGGIDLGGLAYLSNLKHLTLDNYDSPISLREFSQLETFAGEWSRELQLGPDCAQTHIAVVAKVQGQGFDPVSLSSGAFVFGAGPSLDRVT